ncbi:MAG: hypothetical protein VXX39_00425 [Candidatus Thermoplasmatota archaeon]|nr:hypothetical protein [Candidatus Thermoplasmatota archaeon]
MTEEGTITPEVKIKELEEALETQTERLTKLYAAYETQDKELIDLRAEVEVLEKEIIEREIEKESLDSILSEKENKIRELEMKATKASKQVSHLQPELDKMEEKYSREKDRLGKVFSIAEELDNDLKLALVEMRARDEWYVAHMSLFEDLNKAIKERYDLIESRVEAERQSQHMGQVFSDRMDELVEARATEMMDAPAENSEESAAEEAEETTEESPEETTEAVAEEVEIGYSDSVLDRIVNENSIDDVEAFIEFAKDYDKDENNYLKAGELEKAAADWTAKASESEAPAEEEVAEPAPPSTWGDDVDPWQN